MKKAIREEKLKRDIQTNSIAGFNDKKGEFRRERIKRMNKNMVWIILLLSQIGNLIIILVLPSLIVIVTIFILLLNII